MFEVSAFFTYNEVQTSFHVFENSLESIFDYESDCFSNFCFQFINCMWRIPMYNILYVALKIVDTFSQVWRARRPCNRTTSSHSSSRKLSVQIFCHLIRIKRRRTILLEDHAFWIVSKLGKQKLRKHSFVRTSCHISVFKKERPDYLLFRQGAPYHN